MSQFSVGDKVTAFYKTGKYIGEVTDIRPQHYLVKVLAVAKHPMQGDLHNPKEADVMMFHERRALAHREQANIPLQMVKPYNNEIPNYQDSLKEALSNMREELLKDDSLWAKKSLELIHGLEKEYFKS